MLMVLMALLDAGRNKVARATRWLWLLLSGGLVVTAPLSCERNDQVLGADNGVQDPSSEAQPVYGVPVDAITDPGTQDAMYPEVAPVYGVDTCCATDVADVPSFDQPLYGVFVDATADPVTDLPQVLYGPVQVDADQDRPADSTPPPDMIQPLYGPVPPSEP